MILHGKSARVVVGSQIRQRPSNVADKISISNQQQ
jgi:hypothetical protein